MQASSVLYQEIKVYLFLIGSQSSTLGTWKQKTKCQHLTTTQNSNITSIITSIITLLGDVTRREPHDLRRAACHQSRTSTSTCAYLVCIRLISVLVLVVLLAVARGVFRNSKHPGQCSARDGCLCEMQPQQSHEIK